MYPRYQHNKTNNFIFFNVAFFPLNLQQDLQQSECFACEQNETLKPCFWFIRWIKHIGRFLGALTSGRCHDGAGLPAPVCGLSRQGPAPSSSPSPLGSRAELRVWKSGVGSSWKVTPFGATDRQGPAAATCGKSPPLGRAFFK